MNGTAHLRTKPTPDRSVIPDGYDGVLPAVIVPGYPWYFALGGSAREYAEEFDLDARLRGSTLTNPGRNNR